MCKHKTRNTQSQNINIKQQNTIHTTENKIIKHTYNNTQQYSNTKHIHKHTKQTQPIYIYKTNQNNNTQHNTNTYQTNSHNTQQYNMFSVYIYIRNTHIQNTTQATNSLHTTHMNKHIHIKTHHKHMRNHNEMT